MNLTWISKRSPSAASQVSRYMPEGTSPSTRDRGVALAIVIALGGYAFAVYQGLPQSGTAMIVSAAQHANHDLPSQGHLEHSPAAVEGHTVSAEVPPFWAGIPFVLLLGAIAILPLIRATEHWWESNLNRFFVAGTLALLTLGYFAFIHDSPVEGHWPAHRVLEPSPQSANWAIAGGVLQNAILGEYIPFIVLLFSLYTIAGGIRIEGDLRAHPLTNTTFIGIGGLLASFLGTTGAAMLLIRPLLETNRERKYVKHTVIFFIFVVCNCGGCLLPIGDPPLFLGYLKGVAFLWTLNLWKEWLFVNCVLLTIYFVWDHFFAYRHEESRDIRRDESQTTRLRITGLAANGPLLLGVILCVGLLDPSKPVPGTDWHPWMFLREAVQLGLVAASLLVGSQLVRSANRFNYHAIVEVAALFVGIFICMQPVLQILHVKGPELGVDTPEKYFWITGGLSSVLDNAPTYLVFFETARSVGGPDLVAGVPSSFLVAISLGAVFMGSMTYIGNGPNFMVRAIAEKSGVRMPSFFGYMVYSVLILLPVLLLTTLIFF